MNITSEMLLPLGTRAAGVADLLNIALLSVDPEPITIRAIRNLDQEMGLSRFSRLGLVSMGKAAVPMAQAALAVLGDHITSGIVVTKVTQTDYHPLSNRIRLLKGNHPVPGVDSLFAGEAIIQYLEKFDRNDAVLFLISGGTSALVTHPVFAVELQDLVSVTRLLLDCGASIDEINAVRKHLDDCKGGQLAHSTSPAACISLIFSDVPGNRLDVIASGPTVPDPSTFADAMNVLKKYDLLGKVPEAVLSLFTDGVNGTVLETPKPGNTVFTGNRAEIIASLEQAMQAVKDRAIGFGYAAEFYAPLLSGEARERGVQLAEFLRKQAAARLPGDKPCCWIAGGETTVTIKGNGSGGRNQELALAAVEGLAGVEGAALITFATDGEDGQSPAAGAIVTGTTLQEAHAREMDPADYLARNDSYTFFAGINAAIVTGSTGTNVNDLVLLLLN
jgi:glycerate 2-kinase